jgi:MFS family permease
MDTQALPRHRWWILAVVIGGQFMFVVDASIVNVAIPSIRADLQASGGAMEAVIAIYQIGFATATTQLPMRRP